VTKKKGRWYAISDGDARKKVGHAMREAVSQIEADKAFLLELSKVDILPTLPAGAKKQQKEADVVNDLNDHDDKLGSYELTIATAATSASEWPFNSIIDVSVGSAFEF